MVDVTFLIVGNHVWVHTESNPDGIVVTVIMVDVCNVETETGAYNLVYLGVNTTLETVLALFISLIDTFFLVVANTEMIIYTFATTAYCQIMVLLVSRACYKVWPVCG